MSTDSGTFIVRCPNCGATLTYDNDKFCKYCGTKLVNDLGKITVEVIHKDESYAEVETAKIKRLSERDKLKIESRKSFREDLLLGVIFIIMLFCFFFGLPWVATHF